MAQISDQSQSVQESIGIQIKAIQWGGESQQVDTIMSEAVTTCSATNTSACNQVSDDMLSYISQNLPKQFSTDPNGGQGNMVYLGQLTLGSAVSSMGLKIGSSLATPQVLAQRQFINTLYNNVTVYANYFDKLNTQCGSQLSRCRGNCDDDAQDFQQSIKTTLDSINKNGFGCWSDPATCASMVKSQINNTLPIDYDSFHNVVLPAYQYAVEVSFNGNSYNGKYENPSSAVDGAKWTYSKGGIDYTVAEKQDGSNWDVSFKFDAPSGLGGSQAQSWDDKSNNYFFDSSDYDSSDMDSELDEHISVDVSGAGNKKNMDIKFTRGSCVFPTQEDIRHLYDAQDL